MNTLVVFQQILYDKVFDILYKRTLDLTNQLAQFLGT